MILPWYLSKPVMISNMFDNMTWHWCCCILHTSLACIPPSLIFFPFPSPPFPASSWERQLPSIWDQWEPGFVQRMTDPLRGKYSNAITHHYRKVSLHWIPWHNPIKCFSSKQTNKNHIYTTLFSYWQLEY